MVGYVVYLGLNLVYWSSKKQPVVLRSGIETKYKVLAQVTYKVTWIHSFLNELHINLVTTSIIWRDNQSAIALAYNPTYHAKTKHIELDIHFIKRKVAANKIAVQFIPVKTKLQMYSLSHLFNFVIFVAS